MATIPGNALQDHLHKTARQIHKPSFGTSGKMEGVIRKVYDRDTITQDNIPNELCLALLRKPGRLYCKCELVNGLVVYLPFKDSPELIYAIYGDAQLIEGRPCHVLYYDRNVRAGEVVVAPDEYNALKETKNVSNVLDIGGIF
jgi:hypothetical protein